MAWHQLSATRIGVELARQRKRRASPALAYYSSGVRGVDIAVQWLAQRAALNEVD